MKKADKVVYVLQYVCLLGACFCWGWNHDRIFKNDDN